MSRPLRVRRLGSRPATAPLLLKAALPALPVVGLLPGVRHRGEQSDLVLELPGVRTDVDHLVAYNRLCGLTHGPVLAATYPHMPAFALHLVLMTDTSFPFAPMGLVHLQNSISQYRPIGIDEVYDLTVQASAVRPHAKGRLVDVVSEARIDDELVWSEVTTLLARGQGSQDAEPAPLADLEVPVGRTPWELPANLGRSYAAISGDRNPIHLHPVSAKAFGFPRAIAHGMWTLARSLGELETDLGESFRVETEFHKPVLLPTTVDFGRSGSNGRIDFAVTSRDGAATHLVGRVERI